LETHKTIQVSFSRTPVEIEVKSKIINASRDLFFEFGPSRVKMEEIAEKLAMSKKTLYKHFASKDDVLGAVLDASHCEIDVLMQGFKHSLTASTDEQFLQQLSEAGRQMADRLNIVWQSPFLKDIQRSYPEYWQTFTVRRRNSILGMFQMICEDGKKRGVLRSELNYELFTLMYLACIENVMHPTVMNNLQMSGGAVFQMMMAIIFGGVMTDKGREISTQFEHYWMAGNNHVPPQYANGSHAHLPN
jgi:AcrR family transcriptional regulator